MSPAPTELSPRSPEAELEVLAEALGLPVESFTYPSIAEALGPIQETLVNIVKVYVVGMGLFLVCFMLLRFLLHRNTRRRMDRILAGAEEALRLISEYRPPDAVQMWIEANEPLLDDDHVEPYHIALSRAVNHAFDQDPSVLQDPDLVAGVEVRMAVLDTEDYHLCPECQEETAVAVTLMLEKSNGEPVSMIRSVACSTCTWKLVS